MNGTQERRDLLLNALRAVEAMRARVAEAEGALSEPIAVVGIGCRFPGGVRGPDAFWHLLDHGIDAVTEIPEQRWSDAAYGAYAAEFDGGRSRPRGGFLDRVDEFDAHFFGIAPREALTMDPQQRLVLETTWEALEHAGIAADRLRGSLTGVFLGVTAIDYALHLQAAVDKKLDVYLATGVSHNAVAGRVSYFLGLHGPSMAIDTACSSSLTAIHVACQSLRLRESQIAITGGVSTAIVPEWFVSMTRWGMLAPDGRCKAFDAAADGMVRAEGCGIVVLKRLADAVADDDRILSVIRGSAVNQDGPSSGLTVPNGPAQQAVIRQALRAARVAPAQIGYVEAHGTGTTLGDPIELEALDAVMSEGRSKSAPLVVGSVKTNIGHLEAAAGAAGLIKTVLALSHERIPRNLHFTTLNPAITLRQLEVVVPTESIAWPRTSEPRLAAVSAFGLSGTNAHVVLEEPPNRVAMDNAFARDVEVVTLSARSPETLRQQAARWRDHLMAHADELKAGDVARTANAGRAALGVRAAVIARSTRELAAQLDSLATGQIGPGVTTGVVRPQDRPRVVMLFTGQGSQYHGMGRDLYETQPAFREALDRCDAILRDVIGRSIISVMHDPAVDPTLIDRTEFTQPALFALEYAVAQMWHAWGVRPAAVLGHSVGEYVAACVAGVFTLEDALTLIAARGRLMQGLPAGGAMAAALAGEDVVRGALSGLDAVSIAAVNGPDSVVISGPDSAIRQASAALERGGVSVRPLTVSHAFHSALMDPMLEPFEQVAARVSFHAPQLPLVSNLTGAFMGDEPLDATYWTRHLREAVRFADGVRAVEGACYSTYLEVGPSATLAALAKRAVDGGRGMFLASLRRERSAWHELASSAGALFTQGVPIDWDAYNRGFDLRTVTLPTYPFEAQRYWSDAAPRSPMSGVAQQQTASERSAEHPLLGRRLASPLKALQFERQVALHAPSFLADHVINGEAVFPAAAYVEMALAAADSVFGTGVHHVSDLIFAQPLIVTERPVTVQTIVTTDQHGIVRIEILSAATGDQWRTHAAATLERATDTLTPAPLDAARSGCTTAVEAGELMAWYRSRGIEYGPTFQLLDTVWSGAGEAVARLRIPDDLAQEARRFRLHPAITDACMQALAAAMPDREAAPAYVPINVMRVVTFSGADMARWAHVALRSREAGTVVGDVWLYDEKETPVAALLGVRGHAVTRAGAESQRAAEYAVEWAPAGPLPADAPEEPGTWIVIARSDRDAHELASLIRAERGSTATIVAPADGSAADTKRVEDRCCEIASAGPRFRGVIQIAASVARHDEPPRFDELQNDVATMLAATRGALRATASGKLCVMTHGCQSTGGSETVDATAAPLWALARAIAAEHPNLQAICVDGDGRHDALDLAAAWHAVTSRPGESHLALRNGKVLTARLVQVDQSSRRPRTFALDTTARGILDNLHLRPLERREPGRGEVEIAVSHAALNFRDVLNALDMFGGEGGPLGAECVGRVTAIGAGVDSVSLGDQVFGMVAGSLRSHAIVDAELVTRTPSGMDAIAAATIPVAFLTAEYGLNQLARMRRGDRVLIHAATGGVGLAAVQLARQAGAEIFATAGNDEKREVLARIGVAHVFDSRSTDFADQILARTGGRGVDIVLNSLAGEFIGAGIRTLAANGRFVEIGKQGIWSAEQVAAARPDVAYFPVYLGEVDRGLVQQMLRDIRSRVEAGDLTPLPYRAYGIEEAVDAFRFMAQARHIGKIVIECATPSETMKVVDDGTYLITGGFGALGLHCARWLAGCGARHLALVGRRAADRPGAAAAIAELRDSGVDVRAFAADVSNADACAELFEQLAEGPALRGVIHAAGIVEDGTIEHVTLEQFARVFAPKVLGTWHLHQHTRHRPLDFFVMFSSAAALIPSGGQANYAAANAYLDAMAHQRGGLGLPALSVNWGAWAGEGMAADAETPQRWRRSGITPITRADAFTRLERFIAAGSRQVAVLAIDWQTFAGSAPGAVTAFLRNVVKPARTEDRTAEAPALKLIEELERAPLRARSAVVLTHVKQAVRQVLGVDAAYTLEASQGLRELGMDSLMAVELRNHLQAAIGRSLRSTLAFDCPTVGAVAAHLCELLGTDSTADAAVAEPALAQSDFVRDLHDLSDAEAEALLAQELQR